MKFKETAYIHGEAMHAGEFKHGSISLIEPGMPVVCFLGDRATRHKTISNIEEIKARGAQPLIIAPGEHDGTPARPRGNADIGLHCCHHNSIWRRPRSVAESLARLPKLARGGSFLLGGSGVNAQPFFREGERMPTFRMHGSAPRAGAGPFEIYGGEAARNALDLQLNEALDDLQTLSTVTSDRRKKTDRSELETFIAELKARRFRSSLLNLTLIDALIAWNTVLIFIPWLFGVRDANGV